MKQKLLYIAFLAMTAIAVQAQVAFVGNQHEVMQIEPAANTGLKKIFVLHEAEGVSMTYTASTHQPVTFYRYGELGGGYAQALDVISADEGRVYTLEQVVGNSGYIIEEGTTRYYCWVVDYSKYPLTLTSIEADDDRDCGSVTLHVEGQGDEIVYYTINGARRVLSRDLKLSYYDLELKEPTQDDDPEAQENLKPSWEQTLVTELLENYKPVIVMPAPTCNTTFTISGDRFMDFWQEGVSRESNTWSTVAVGVHATATQEKRENDNEKKSESQGALGGSAPVHITFEAFCTDEVVHKEWQMALDPEFNNIQLRLNQEVVEQDFNDAGTTYWRFIGSNNDGSCEAVSDVFTVDIGVSELVCPNVFTPGTSIGTNDVWKVSYRSITDFHCWIFNRWGNQIIEFTDPSQGWDGTYHGKLVGPGVYYYVIQAQGSDGKKYKLSGDINIIRYKDRSSSSTGPVSPTTTDDPNNEN